MTNGTARPRKWTEDCACSDDTYASCVLLTTATKNTGWWRQGSHPIAKKKEEEDNCNWWNSFVKEVMFIYLFIYFLTVILTVWECILRLRLLTRNPTILPNVSWLQGDHCAHFGVSLPLVLLWTRLPQLLKRLRLSSAYTLKLQCYRSSADKNSAAKSSDYHIQGRWDAVKPAQWSNNTLEIIVTIIYDFFCYVVIYVFSLCWHIWDSSESDDLLKCPS